MDQRGRLYTGQEDVLRRENGVWAQLGDFNLAVPGVNANGHRLSAIGLSRENEGVIYAAFYSAPAHPHVLFKTANADAPNPADVTWQELGASNATGPFSWEGGRVTAIAVDPLDADRVWVALDRFKRTYKVIFSEDGGNTWINLSEGLPDYPVNDIILQEGANNVLYAATDVGVFVNTAANDGENGVWECINDGLPPCIVWDLDINYCKGKLIAGTFGRSAWETDIPVKPDKAQHLAITQTWDTDRFLHSDLVIDPGVTLTIKCKVYVGKGRRLLVKPNAKLIIEGGLLTNNCGEYWKGIEVEGQTSQHQFIEPNGSRHQGYLSMHNATIQNALCAVRLCNTDAIEPDGDNPTSGGVVIAGNSYFVNNLTGIAFAPYQNIKNGVHYDNLSHFTQCLFEVNAQQPEDDEGSTFKNHVFMDAVDGIRFQGCTFVNDKPHTSGMYAEQRGLGIWSQNSGFRVEGACQDAYPPCVHWNNSEFKGLAIGIYANALGSVNTFKADRCAFSDNQWGVLAFAVNQLSVTRCAFDVGSQSPSQTGNNAQGFTIYSGTGFTVEDNSLQTYPLAYAPAGAIGIFVISAGEEDNRVYNNVLKNLPYANLSNGINGGKEQGLRYLCNQNQLNGFDFAVPDENSPFTGIAIVQQGDQSTAAGNKFTPLPPYGETHFYNHSQRPVRYFYWQGSQVETPVNFTTDKVSLVGTLNTNICSSNLPPDDDDISEGEKSADQTTLEALAHQLDSAKNALKVLLDGGNTPALLQQIGQTGAAHAAQLKADLLALSPYLSAQALKAAADRTDIWSDADISLFFKANPDESIHPELLQYLEIKADPMPQLLIEEIRDTARVSTTPRTAQENAISALSQTYSSLANPLAHHLLTDTLRLDFEALRALWHTGGGLSEAYSEVESHLHQANTAQAQALLNQIPQQYQLSGTALDEHLHYARLLGLGLVAVQTGSGLQKVVLDSMLLVEKIVENSRGKAAVVAKGLVNYAKGMTYYPPVVLPQANAQPMQQDRAGSVLPAAQNKNNTSVLSIVPNPNGGSATIQYACHSQPGQNLRLEIMDAGGRIKYSISLAQPQGRVDWQGADYAPGVYIVRLTIDGAPIQTERLIVIR